MADLHVLVCGATGNQGGAVARLLLERGHRVTALTRDPGKAAARELEQAGATVAACELTSRSDCDRALDGVDAAFLVATPYELGPEAEVRQGTTFAEAAAAGGLRYLVYTSVAGARADTGLPNFESKLTIERRIEELGLRHTVLAPVYFMENVFVPDALAALRAGRLAVPMTPQRPLQQIAVRDIGRFAVLALEDPDRFAGRRIEIAGDDLPGAEAARILGEVLECDVAYVPVPLAAVREQAPHIAAMFQWFEDVGFDVDIAALHGEHPEVGWHDFRSWARERVPAVVG